jgi:hypothetical protein
VSSRIVESENGQGRDAFGWARPTLGATRATRFDLCMDANFETISPPKIVGTGTVPSLHAAIKFSMLDLLSRSS